MKNSKTVLKTFILYSSQLIILSWHWGIESVVLIKSIKSNYINDNKNSLSTDWHFEAYRKKQTSYLKQFVINIKAEIFPVFDKKGDCSRFRWTMVYWFKSARVSDYLLALGMYISRTMENDYFLPLPCSCSDKMK